MADTRMGGRAHDDGAVIRTSRLRVRRPEAADATDIATAANDPRVAAHLRDTFPSPYAPADARDWIAMPRAHPLQGLVIERDGRVIGAIGLDPGADVHRHGAELGYWLGHDHWGAGYMSEAVAALCDRAFATTTFQRLYAVVFDGNPVSDRVLLKCGFVLEGVARRAIFKNGRFLDARTYARLKSEDATPSGTRAFDERHPGDARLAGP